MVSSDGGPAAPIPEHAPATSSAWTEHSMQGVDHVHDSAPRTSATASPEAELEALWDQGQRPDVMVFLAARGGPSLAAEALVCLLWVDQRRRWLIGEPVNLHSYRTRFPVLFKEPEAFFELLYHEILVRESLGEEPDPEEYAHAFPELAPRLRLQFEVHDALSSVDLSGDDSDLTGRAPFAERSFHQTIARLPSEPPEPPSRISRAAPRPLELICPKCLEKEPSRRYASAEALAEDLKRYLAGEPLEARPVSTSPRLWLWVRRHPTQSALAAALVVAMLAGAAVSTTLWLRAEASLKAERSAREMLQLTTGRLDRSHNELERATKLEREARLRAQERLDLALRAVQDTIHGPGNTSILLLTDAQATRQGVLHRIVELYKNLQASLEGDLTPEGQSQLASSYDRLGELTAEIGSVDVARAAYAKAHEIRRELSASSPGDRHRLYDVAIAVIQQAKFERGAGQPALALDLYRQGHAQLESLALANPFDQRLWGDLAWCLGNVGALELRTDPETAYRTHLKVLDIRERLIRDNPADVTLRSDRAWGRLDVALCLRRLDHRNEAIAWVDLARVEFEVAHAERPCDVNITVRLVDCLSSLADAQASATDHVASLDASQRACNLNDELAKAHPDVPLYQEMLARNLRLQYQRQLAARLPGRASLERATRIYQELVKTYPGVSHFRSELIRALLDLAYNSREEGDAARALEAAQRAVDFSGIFSLDPDTESTRAITANCHLHLAMAAADVKQFETTARELRAAEEMMRQLKQPNGLLFYNRACCLALLGRMTASSAARRAFEDEAMSALWQAFNAGYRNKRALTDDHDIDGLRSRPDFKLLRLDLDFPVEPIAR